MNETKTPAIYLIGGGPLGMRTLRTARELGLRLIVTDRDANAPGLASADEAHVIDGGDVAGHVALANATRERVVGVYCGAEFGVAAASAVRARLALETNDPHAVRRVLDKEEMKLAFLQDGVPTPMGAVAETADELVELMQTCERVVVKPLGGSGSRGVRVIAQGANPRAVLATALASVPDERAVLVEPFVEGRLIDVNGILIEGELHPAGLLEKFSTPLPARLPVGGCDPTDLSPAQATTAYDLLADAAAAIGLMTGPVKADLILSESGFQVLEVGARFHGDVTTAGTLPFGSGIDPVRAYLHWCLTGELEHSALEPTGRGHAAWRVIALPPGTLLRQPDEGLAADFPQIGLAWHRFRPGDRIEPYEDTTRIPGYVTAHGATAEAAEAALAAWFERSPYEVEPDPAHTDWYARLVEELSSTGLTPMCSGVPSWAH